MARTRTRGWLVSLLLFQNNLQYLVLLSFNLDTHDSVADGEEDVSKTEEVEEKKDGDESSSSFAELSRNNSILSVEENNQNFPSTSTPPQTFSVDGDDDDALGASINPRMNSPFKLPPISPILAKPSCSNSDLTKIPIANRDLIKRVTSTGPEAFKERNILGQMQSWAQKASRSLVFDAIDETQEGEEENEKQKQSPPKTKPKPKLQFSNLHNITESPASPSLDSSSSISAVNTAALSPGSLNFGEDDRKGAYF